MFSELDYTLMARALRLAERGMYSTTPNPRVGCVLVRGGELVGEGWHERAGEPHAEVHALRQAGERSRGATAYVTLEPCSHHGRTPPCADALIGAGVKRVVAAMRDPNPLVAGAGLARLAASGIEVAAGLLEPPARELNIGFVARMERGRPWLRLKLAASLDGKTALNNGISKWITSEAARRDVHRLRARSCALLTGSGTVLADDPELTARLPEVARQPMRIVVDSQLILPPEAKLLVGSGALVATTCRDVSKIDRIQAAGAQVLQQDGVAGRVDLQALMLELGQRGYNEITVEAGAGLAGALLQASLVDELVLYLAPLLMGNQARGLFDLPELTDMAGRRPLRIVDSRQVGPDLRLTARFEADKA